MDFGEEEFQDDFEEPSNASEAEPERKETPGLETDFITPRARARVSTVVRGRV